VTITKSISSGAQYVILHKESPTHAGLAQDNGFGSPSLHWLPWLVKAKAAQPCAHAEKSVTNMI